MVQHGPPLQEINQGLRKKEVEVECIEATLPTLVPALILISIIFSTALWEEIEVLRQQNYTISKRLKPWAALAFCILQDANVEVKCLNQLWEHITTVG